MKWMRESGAIPIGQRSRYECSGWRKWKHVACCFVGGHEYSVRPLLDRRANINARGGQHGNALQASAANKHENLLKFLLGNGADIDAEDGGYGNALLAASWERHDNVRGCRIS